MGNGPSRQPKGGYPRNGGYPSTYPSTQGSWTSRRKRHKVEAEAEAQGWLPNEMAYQYPSHQYPFHPQPFLPKNYDPQNAYPYAQPVPYPLPYPPIMLPPGMQPVIPDLLPPPPPAPRDAVPTTERRSTRTRPRRKVTMPEPATYSSSNGSDDPVVPRVNTPYPSPNAPAVPPSRSRSVPVATGPSFPQPHVIPEPTMPEPQPRISDPRLTPGQYGPQDQHPIHRATTPHHRPRGSNEGQFHHQSRHHRRTHSEAPYPRQGDAHLREDPRERNPLPTPPKDIFEYSPYVGLLDDLKRPPEETTLRKHPRGNHTIIIGKAQIPPAPGPIPAPTPLAAQTSQGDSTSSREKKERKGLFRSLSSKLTSSRPKDVNPPLRTPLVQPPQFVYVMQGPEFDAPYPYDPVPPPPPSKSRRSPIPRQRSVTPVQFVAPPSPAPSHRSRHSDRVRTPTPPGQLPPPPPVKVSADNEFSGLTPYSAHDVLHDKKVYPTAYHLFEALKFLGHRSDVADMIRTSRTGGQVRRIVDEMKAFAPQDWEDRAATMMDEVLYHKFIQHPDLRALLLSTEGSEIIFSSQQDDYWGDGGLGGGINELGKCLVRVRERLRDEYSR